MPVITNICQLSDLREVQNSLHFLVSFHFIRSRCIGNYYRASWTSKREFYDALISFDCFVEFPSSGSHPGQWFRSKLNLERWAAHERVNFCVSSYPWSEFGNRKKVSVKTISSMMSPADLTHSIVWIPVTYRLLVFYSSRLFRPFSKFGSLSLGRFRKAGSSPTVQIREVRTRVRESNTHKKYVFCVSSTVQFKYTSCSMSYVVLALRQ